MDFSSTSPSPDEAKHRSGTAEKGKEQIAPQIHKKISSACCVQSTNLKKQLVKETAYCPGSRQENISDCYPLHTLAFPAREVLQTSLAWRRRNSASGHRPVVQHDLLFCNWFLQLDTHV